MNDAGGRSRTRVTTLSRFANIVGPSGTTPGAESFSVAVGKDNIGIRGPE